MSDTDARPGRWLCNGPSSPTRRDVWTWWQQRRRRFNRDLLIVGSASWLLVVLAGSAAVERGEDFVEPLVLILGPLLYGFFANAAYTAGPIIDTVLSQGVPRRALFKAGYTFSILLTALPGAWAISARSASLTNSE